FMIVCGAVLIMRRTNPEAKRPFRCPLVPVVPILGIALCLMLMMSLPVGNWVRLVGWLALGLVIYFLYGRRHSELGQGLKLGMSAHAAAAAAAGGAPPVEFTQGTPATPPTDVIPDRRGTQEKPGQ